MIHHALSGKLLGTEDGRFSFVYDSVTYRATRDFQALGVLVFGLQPKGYAFHCKTDPRPCQQGMLAAALEFHKHANGGKRLLDGSSRFTSERLMQWIEDEADLAPDAATKQEVIKAIVLNLGPDAFKDEAHKPVARQ